MKKLMLGAAIALVLVGSAEASDWRLMSYSQDVITALERDGLRSHRHVRNGWVVYGLPDPTAGLDYFMTRYEWDCSLGTSRALHTIAYLASEAVHEEAGTGEVQVVVPDTDEAIVFQAACDGVDPAPNHPGWRSVAELLDNYRSTLPPI